MQQRYSSFFVLIREKVKITGSADIGDDQKYEQGLHVAYYAQSC